MRLFVIGARVDITIPGAEVISHGATQLHFRLPGVDAGPFVLPVRDDRAQAVIEVATAVPRLQPGEMYVSPDDQRLVAIDYEGHGVHLVDPLTGKYYDAATAVEVFGPLHLAVPAPTGADQPAASADPDATATLPTVTAYVYPGADRIVVGDAATPVRAEGALPGPAGSTFNPDEVHRWEAVLKELGWSRSAGWRFNEDASRWQVAVVPAPPVSAGPVT